MPSTFRGVAETVDGKPGPRRARWPWVLAGTMGFGLAAGALWLTVANNGESDESTVRPSERSTSRKSTGGKRKKAGGDQGQPESKPPGATFDRKHFDPIAFAPRAAPFAREYVGDPELNSVSARGLNRQGLIDMTKVSSYAVYYFKARGGDACAHVRVSVQGVTAAKATSDYCPTENFGTLRCTVGQIMERASRNGAPPNEDNGLLSINVQIPGRPTWNLIFGGEWKRSGVDDC
jgi:hypothetical protein